LTDKGSSFIGLISEMQPNYNWSYYPVAEFKDSKYDILFSKLSKRSNYIFRIDINHINKINDVLSLLMKNSNDPIFLGYPYGLVEADKFARVSNKELELLKTKFMIKAGKDWKSINNLLKTKDSHGILDRIS
jgi:NurA-like 5'-3' nuclease